MVTKTESQVNNFEEKGHIVAAITIVLGWPKYNRNMGHMQQDIDLQKLATGRKFSSRIPALPDVNGKNGPE